MNVTTVFLSSTHEDLKPHREAVKEALRGLDEIRCVAMEEFGARAEAPDSLCRGLVAQADLFVGILGHCYGSCPHGSQLSFTIGEFEAADEARRPQLVFLLAEEVTPDREEPMELRERQQRFRAQVRERLTAAFFSNSAELALKVVQSVSNWLRRRELEVHGSEFLRSLRALNRQSGLAGAAFLIFAAVAALGSTAMTLRIVLSGAASSGSAAVWDMVLFLVSMALGVAGLRNWNREVEESVAPYRYIDEGNLALRRLFGDEPPEPH